MKNKLSNGVIITFLLFGFSALGQSENNTNIPPGFLYTEFNLGTVKMKSGATEQVPLNYHVTDQSFMYKKDGQYYSITNPEDIDSILLNKEVYIPVNGKFFTVITKTPIPLLMSYDAKINRMVATSDQVATEKRDQSVVFNTVTDSYTTKKFQQNQHFIYMSNFWLKNGNNVYRANDAKQVSKVFPKLSSEIYEYVKANKTDFKKLEDVVKLNEFCNK